MSQSRIHDLILMLGGLAVVPACTQPPVDDDDGGVSPDDQDALDDALAACKPYARKISGCYAMAYPDSGYSYGYVAAVGSCVASIGYYADSGDGCQAAYSDYFACLGALDCEEILGDDDTVEPGGTEPETYPCMAEEQALEQSCESPEVDGAQTSG